MVIEDEEAVGGAEPLQAAAQLQVPGRAGGQDGPVPSCDLCGQRTACTHMLMRENFESGKMPPGR